jgi:hypothetical protein
MFGKGENIDIPIAVPTADTLVAVGLRVSDVLGAGWRLVFDASVRLWFVCYDHPDTDVVYEEVKK